MAKSISDEQKRKWKENIHKQRQSKLSVPSRCRQNEVAVHSFYYWESKLSPKPFLDRAAFTEVVEEKNTFTGEIILEHKEFNIRLIEHFNPSILKRCLEVLIKC